MYILIYQKNKIINLNSTKMSQEIDKVWIEEQTVKSFQMGPDLRLKVTSIFELLQEAAGNHANYRKFGFQDMLKQGRFWVLSRIKIISLKPLPKWTEKLVIETWVKSVEGATSERDFLIKNQRGEIVIKGSSLWYSLDIKQRKPLLLESFKKEAPVRNDLKAIENIERITSNNQADYSKNIKVSYSDLDAAQHVNNIRYISWALDSYPIDTFQNSRVNSLTVNFLSETKFNEEVEILTEELKEDNIIQFTTSVRHKNTGKTMCIIQSKWVVINKPLSTPALV